jgi:N-acetylglucosamine-6-phosphate deacetylase
MGSVPVDVRDGVVRTLDGVLAGSVLTMAAAVRSLVRLGATLEQAVDAGTRAPARAGRVAEVGRLAPGCPADVAVVDEDLAVTRTLVAGAER